ncbi:HNH endonuclease signature motif containing protein [Nocardioides speluncae]|uniref:HNH endonuclease signature motif containing protein n=1 Tax=Nocardioides speluncae TaxID=2670337 RepID=UPI00137AF960|nr:HNH endonuclease signature motif containing protein [Nocardioides speluncae]
MTATAFTSTSSTATSAALLAGVRADRAAADAAEARILAAAAAWAEMHPAAADADAAAYWEHGVGMPMAGEGTPLVAEWCVAELAAALGLTTDAGKSLIGHAVELRHRLPRLWDRVHAGDLQAWRARRIADHTPTLSPAAANYVDRHVAPVAHKIGPAQTQRLIDEAIARIDPASVVETAEISADRRHVTIHRDQVSFNGTLHIDADLDIADAHDLDAALSDRAAVLKNLGCTESLDVRRSLALGDLARTQLGLDLKPTRTREVVLHVHLTDAAITGAAADDVHVARLEEGDRLLLADQVRDWCGRPETQVTVKPVIDLTDRLATGAYEIPDRIRDHVIARDPACVFPHCTRNARSCDLDHITPYARGGRTATYNLAPLCRRHHRLKTHAGWRYRRDPDGTYHWTSPHGLAYQRDHQGTTPLDPAPPDQ